MTQSYCDTRTSDLSLGLHSTGHISTIPQRIQLNNLGQAPILHSKPEAYLGGLPPRPPTESETFLIKKTKYSYEEGNRQRLTKNTSAIGTPNSAPFHILNMPQPETP